MDSILLKDIDTATRIGISEKERSVPQRIKISVEIFLPLKKTGATGDLKFGIDYDLLIEIVKNFSSKEHKTIEALAEEIAGTILTKFSPKGGVTVTVKKKPYPDMNYAAVKIHRS